MRAALAESIERGPTMELYPRGAIVCCVSCARPIYRLERSIGIGEKASRAVLALRPVAVSDLEELAQREDVDPGVRAVVRAIPQRAHYADTIERPRAGDGAICPKCGGAMIVGRTAETSDTIDRAYVMELHCINPVGHAQARLTRKVG